MSAKEIQVTDPGVGFKTMPLAMLLRETEARGLTPIQVETISPETAVAVVTIIAF